MQTLKGPHLDSTLYENHYITTQSFAPFRCLFLAVCLSESLGLLRCSFEWICLVAPAHHEDTAYLTPSVLLLSSTRLPPFI